MARTARAVLCTVEVSGSSSNSVRGPCARSRPQRASSRCCEESITPGCNRGRRDLHSPVATRGARAEQAWARARIITERPVRERYE